MLRIDYVGMGKRIRAARKAQKLTQEELGAQIGVSKTYIGQLERGTKTPRIATLVSICYALDISPNTLLFDSLPEDMFDEPVSSKISLRQPAGLLRNTLTNWLIPEFESAVHNDETVADLSARQPIHFTLLGETPVFRQPI